MVNFNLTPFTTMIDGPECLNSSSQQFRLHYKRCMTGKLKALGFTFGDMSMTVTNLPQEVESVTNDATTSSTTQVNDIILRDNPPCPGWNSVIIIIPDSKHG
jgi:hypothetical protein